MGVFTLLFKAKKYANKHKRKFITLLVVFIIFNAILYFYKKNINGIINESIEIKCQALVVNAMNNAISEVIMENVIYEDIIEIMSDNEGNITFIKANSLEINNLSKILSSYTESYINTFGKDGIGVPIGNFTGIPLLVGMGPNVNLKIRPIGAVNCKFSSKFETAGINQTNHKIYLTISSTVSTVLPLATSKIYAEQEVLISESVIIGKVPEVYLYSDQLDTMLNFVPH